MGRRNFSLAVTVVVWTLVQPLGALALDQVQLRIVGLDDADLAQSLRASATLFSLEKGPATAPRDVIAAAQGDYTKLVETLYAQGYYSAVVTIGIDGQEAARIDPFRDPQRIGTVVVTVDPGPPFRLGQARIAPLAGDNPPIEEFRPGAPALATVVRDAVKTAVGDWRETGHAKADIASQDIAARHDSARLDVDVAIAPGPRVRFGETSISGHTTVREPRVRQIAGLPKGETFATSEVDRAAARLRKTGTFQSVQVEEAERVNPDGTLDMEVIVVDRKPRRLGGGLEFSNLDGLSLNGYWLHRNIFGGAERFRVDATVSQIGTDIDGFDYGLSFRLDKPAVYGPDTAFYTTFGLSHDDERDYRSQAVGLAVGVSREFTENLTAELGLGLGYAEVTDRFATPETTRSLLLAFFEGAVTYDKRDNVLNAKNGYYLRADAKPYVEVLEGEQQGLHLTFDGRAYRALDRDERTVAAARLQLGALLGPDAVKAPPGMLFYSGGGGTVRGQPYQSLDATYGDGETLGGRSFAALSGELRFEVTKTIGVVGFADAGFVGGDNFDDGAWHAGAGLGLRYNTPVGPIRVDLAAPVAGETGDGVQIYIGIGQAF